MRRIATTGESFRPQVLKTTSRVLSAAQAGKPKGNRAATGVRRRAASLRIIHVLCGLRPKAARPDSAPSERLLGFVAALLFLTWIYYFFISIIFIIEYHEQEHKRYIPEITTN